MSDTTEKMERGVYRVLAAQALMTVVAVGGFSVYLGGYAAVSALYGGAISLISTWWLARVIRRASTLAARDVAVGSRLLYGGLVQKYALAVMGLAAGLGAFKLSPLPLLLCFVLTQAGFLFAAGQNNTGKIN